MPVITTLRPGLVSAEGPDGTTDFVVSGGFFEEGDVLLRIDDHDYRQAEIRARAQVTQAELQLALQEAEAEVALEEWEEIGSGNAGPLNLREPQLPRCSVSAE